MARRPGSSAAATPRRAAGRAGLGALCPWVGVDAGGRRVDAAGDDRRFPSVATAGRLDRAALAGFRGPAGPRWRWSAAGPGTPGRRRPRWFGRAGAVRVLGASSSVVATEDSSGEFPVFTPSRVDESGHHSSTTAMRATAASPAVPT